MTGVRPTLRAVWRIASPYFSSEDKWAGRGLLAAVIAIELGLVAIDVLINQWRGRFFNALQERDWATFSSEMLFFCILAAASVALAVYQLYLNQWLQIRWRRWMTARYLGEWLNDAKHYQMQLQGDVADNPDQRIAEDTQKFVEQTLRLGIGLLSSIVTLASFVVILWGLSAAAPLHLFGMDYDIPGYLVWGALIYAVFGTALTHWIGAPLIGLNFRQQRFEADFRFSLVRVRENAEQIALLHGERAERSRLGEQFGRVMHNWLEIMSRTKRLTAFTRSYDQAAVVFPYVLVAPAYFAGKMQVGGVIQTASAFGSVQAALSFFVSAYRELAEWAAVVERLRGFEVSVAGAAVLAKSSGIDRIAAEGGGIALDDLLVRLPNGAPLVAADALTFKAGESTLVVGPSGSGKSTLFRAIAGIWPFGAGRIAVPRDAPLMMLPQRPYFPLGTLRAAIAYPSEPASFDDATMRDAITAMGLPALAERLDEEGHWNRILSLGEQQRLAMTRALLHKPRFLFLDEATASLDEPSEAALYRLLQTQLPDTTLVSIGHRSTLEPIHQRKVSLGKSGETFAVRDATAG